MRTRLFKLRCDRVVMSFTLLKFEYEHEIANFFLKGKGSEKEIYALPKDIGSLSDVVTTNSSIYKFIKKKEISFKQDEAFAKWVKRHRLLPSYW